MKTKYPVRWRTKTTWVDIDTGEELTKHVFKQNYKRIAHEIYTEFNYLRTAATRHITIKGRHRKLEELPFTD